MVLNRSITHEIYKSFDKGHEVRGVFLDFSKAFHKVWHDGIIFKLTQNGISGNLLKLLHHFLSERRQRIVLNCQASTWTNVTVVAVNKDFEMIHNWAFQWKMNFNPEPSKQAQEVIFSCKTKKLPHPPLVFNNANVTQSIYQQHLDIILDSKLTFENHINMVTTETNKTIGLICKLQNLLPRTALITICKAFLDPKLIMVKSSTIKLLICPFNKN